MYIVLGGNTPHICISMFDFLDGIIQKHAPKCTIICTIFYEYKMEDYLAINSTHMPTGLQPFNIPFALQKGEAREKQGRE